MLRFTSWLAALSVVLCPGSTTAQDAAALASPQPLPAPPPPTPFGGPSSGHAWASAQIDSAIYVANGGSVVSADLLTLQLDLGFALFRADGAIGFGIDEAGHTRVAAGNVELSALGNVPLGPEHRLSIGGGIAIPTARNGPTSCGFSTVPCLRDGATRAQAWAVGVRHAPSWADLSVTLWPALEYTLGVPWFLLQVDAAAPIFFPIVTDTDGARWGGPQPLARGEVELMVTLHLATAVRLSTIVDVGAAFDGWAILTGLETPLACGPACPHSHRQGSQGAISAFVRTDPELDAPVGGAVEIGYDLAPWWVSTSNTAGPQPWSLRFSLFGRFDTGT